MLPTLLVILTLGGAVLVSDPPVDEPVGRHAI